VNRSTVRPGFIFFMAIVLCTVAFSLSAQNEIPLLERTITLSLREETFEDALKKIGHAGQFTFSYKSSLVKKKDKVTFEFTNQTVREILDLLFQGSIEYKERGKYIILVKATKTSSTASSVLSGYVIDEATGRRLKNVSIYDPASLSSTITDSYGYFKIEIKNPTGEEVRLAVQKRQYTDTLVVVPKGSKRLMNVPIRVSKEKFNSLADSVSSKLKRLWLATKEATEQAVNMENIQDTIFRKKQISLIPFVGTNGKLSGNVINDYSLNIWGGHSLGNRKVEVAGLFNTTRGNVEGFQCAGLFNGVLGKQEGVQLGGIANATLDSAKGVQLAGLLNFNFGSSTGFKGAGLFNLSLRSSAGTQMGGIGNVVIGEQIRPQLAGLFNLTTRNVRPAQIAGLFNFTTGNLRGTQIAGTLNAAAGDVQGAQVSGLINLATQSLNGLQLGLINISSNVTGAQIGVLNISNRMQGMPIGFLSFVAKGYHKLEISSDEIFYTNIAFRTGVRQFYNILTVGAKPNTFQGKETLWNFGYGVGTAPKIARGLHLNFDVTSSQIVSGNTLEKINLLNKAFAGLDFRLAKNFSIVAGVTLNGHLTDSTYEAYPDIFTDYIPDIFKERDFSSDLNLKMWWGGKVGLRFF
jgi:hypothetical protein